MAKFCGACGSHLSDASAFCIHCGTPSAAPLPAPAPAPASTPASVPAATPTPAQAPYAQAPYAQINAPAPYAQVGAPGAAQPLAPGVKKSGSGLKLLLLILGVLFIGALLALGALFYIGHRVVNKIKATAAESGLSLPGDKESVTAAFHGDACGLLSKDDVSTAIGVPVVATHNTGDGCEYLAQGTASDMTARHMAAMIGTKGADNEQQEMVRKLGGLFNAQPGDAKEKDSDANGTTPVFAFSVDANSAKAQMKLNSKLLGLGVEPPQLEGIGDEAFDTAGAMMLVRKGEKLIRITYTSCPCSTDAIKPLARKLADAI